MNYDFDEEVWDSVSTEAKDLIARINLVISIEHNLKEKIITNMFKMN